MATAEVARVVTAEAAVGAHGSEQMHVNQLLLLEGGAETAEAEPFEQRRQFARVAARRLGRTGLGRTGLGRTGLGRTGLGQTSLG